MYDEYDDAEGGSSMGRKLALGIGVVAIAAAGFFAFRAVTKDDGGDEAVAPADGSVAVATTDGSLSTSLGDDPGLVETTEASDTTDDAVTGSASSDPETSDVGPTTRATTTTDAPSAAPVATTSPATPATEAVPATYPTRLDGSPEWVTVIYDADSITLKGVVPDDAAKERLQALAVANGRPEQQATVNNQVTLNPAMPREVGIRVVELTSTRFPPGSDEILMPHAAEINRVVNAMGTLPNTTVLVIGHADQQGDEVVNYVLSRDRANAVQAYLISQGIAPERVMATAVGEEELLSLDDDEAALALNRRTEFVLFNLLVP